MNKKSALRTNNFLKITALILACAQTNLFAPKGGPCTSGGDTYTGRGECFSGFGSGHCAAPCMGDARSYGANGSDHGNGYSSGSQGSSSSSTQSGPARPDWSLSAAQLKNRILSECYITPNGQVCTKTQVVEAAQKLTGISLDLLIHGQAPTGYLKELLVAKLFGYEIAPLGCAVARRAAIEECKKAADTIQKEADARIQQSHQQAQAIRQRLTNAGLWNE